VVDAVRGLLHQHQLATSFDDADYLYRPEDRLSVVDSATGEFVAPFVGGLEELRIWMGRPGCDFH
jgi:hypothetical protein